MSVGKVWVILDGFATNVLFVARYEAGATNWLIDNEYEDTSRDNWYRNKYGYSVRLQEVEVYP